METIRVTYKTVQGYVKDLDNYTDFEKLLDGYSQTVKIGGKYAYKRHLPSDECLKQIGELLATMWPARVFFSRSFLMHVKSRITYHRACLGRMKSIVNESG